jgi:hypothetical protein
MKKILMMGIALLVAVVWAQGKTLSLAEARARIGEAVSDPAVMTEIVSQLSASDQVAFLAMVNEAVGKMPGSPTEKAAAYVNVNTAAMKGAASGNLAPMLAETYATVPPEALPAVNERFANDLFNRSAENGMTDAAFVKIVESTMKTITERNASSDNAGVRDTFAALMFLAASNGSPADLRETIVETLPADVRPTANGEWMPAALGENQPQSYEPMLGASDAGESVNTELVLRVAGPQTMETLLADLAGTGTPVTDASRVAGELIASEGFKSNDVVPRTQEDVPWNPEEPRGYPGQQE